jgi:transposase
VFRDLVLARIIEPTSKLDTIRVLGEAGIEAASYATIKRRLPTDPPRRVRRLSLLGKFGCMSAGTKRYPQELKARAVQMVIDARGGEESEWATISRVAALLGIGSPETVRKWLRQAEIDSGSRLGATTEESVELKRLKRENAELRRANAILKAASAFFAAELDRPHQ